MHIGFHLQWLARRWPMRTALEEAGTALTFREFAARANRVGNALAGLGLARGDRVALLIPDCREYLEADYGTMAAGFVRVPLDTRLEGRDLSSLLVDSGARALITHAVFAEKLASVEAGLPQHRLVIGGDLPGGTGYEAALARASDRPPPLGDPDDLATLNYSGGTTGAPKAIMLSHRCLMSAAQNTIMGFGMEPANTFLNVRPLWPIAQILVMSHLFAGSKVVLGGRFDAEALPALIADSGSDRTSLVPTLLVRLLERYPDGDARIDAIKGLYVGGSRIPKGVFEQALDAIGPCIGVLYGLTEAPVSCYLPPADTADPQRRGRLLLSAGRPLFGIDLALENEGHRVSEPAEEGEIVLRGNNVMLGYWNRPEETAAALRDGWLHTGDIGMVDDEGYLTVVSRLKEIIRTGSTSVTPQEVEDVLAGHPAVAEAAVVGLPDREWGEVVSAFVVLRDGEAASAEALQCYCRDRLAGYKQPRRVEFVDSLPRSHYGKVLKTELIAGVTEA